MILNSFQIDYIQSKINEWIKQYLIYQQKINHQILFLKDKEELIEKCEAIEEDLETYYGVDLQELLI